MDHSKMPRRFEKMESWHLDTLRPLPASPSDADLLYAYTHVLHGFSAVLTSSQLSQLKKSPAFLASYPERFGKFLTTHSPQFLGLQSDSFSSNSSSFGDGVIVGLIDSAIWPESPSFKDHGMPSIPKRRKGNPLEEEDEAATLVQLSHQLTPNPENNSFLTSKRKRKPTEKKELLFQLKKSVSETNIKHVAS